MNTSATHDKRFADRKKIRELREDHRAVAGSRRRATQFPTQSRVEKGILGAPHFSTTSFWCNRNSEELFGSVAIAILLLLFPCSLSHLLYHQLALQ